MVERVASPMAVPIHILILILILIDRQSANPRTRSAGSVNIISTVSISYQYLLTYLLPEGGGSGVVVSEIIHYGILNAHDGPD